ncbi:hypothetical protein MMC28_011318 [Mycoblastus sanguinarius]|nr:hypothetical protein [Mycoblastus sanguinarius]
MRTRSYFLVNAIIRDSLTFAIDPKLLDGGEAPERKMKGGEEGEGEGEEVEEEHDRPKPDDDPASGTLLPRDPDGRDNDRDQAEADEQTSLLPESIVRGRLAAERFGYDQGQNQWQKFPRWAQSFLSFSYAFLHAPLVGAVTGVVIGLAPPLHKTFFGAPDNRGIFTAWLTDSIKQIGELFAALQVVVVGVKLSSSMRKMKRGEDSGTLPWAPMIFVSIIRFVIWPAISISLIFLLASRTNLLDNDPILWFAVMLMPTGPPAMKLTALADVAGSNESEKMSIAKFLSIMYAISPLICFTVVGALKASKAAMGNA